MKEGRELPPPPPPTINPDYVQCPHCLRRFNQSAAERHIIFCAEQAKRLAHKNPSPGNISKQAALRASARLKYRPPLLHPSGKRTSDGSNAKFSPSGTTRTQTNKPFAASSSRLHTSALQEQSFQGKSRTRNAEWNPSFETKPNASDIRTKTGLKPVGSANSSTFNGRVKSGTSRRDHQQTYTKPTVRKVAGKVVSGNITREQRYSDFSSDDFHTDSDRTEQGYFVSAGEKSKRNHHSRVNGSRNRPSAYESKIKTNQPAYSAQDYANKQSNNRGEYSDGYYNSGASEMARKNNDFYNWESSAAKPSYNMSKNIENSSSSKFCHECGTRFPITNAKFCCECGVRRILLS